MPILGIAVVMLAAILVCLLAAPYGTLLIIAGTFGLVLSMSLANQRMRGDLQKIKEKLGIKEQDDFHLSDEQIEAELEQELAAENRRNELSVNEEAPPSVTLRTIRQDEAEAYWKLRLEGLRTNPEAFASSYEESVDLSLEDVKQRMGSGEDNYILGAYNSQGELVGMTGFVREGKRKLRHKGLIWGVYVSPAFQGQGIAGRLLNEVIARGEKQEGLEQIHLAVTKGNEPAVRLYTKTGFGVYGREKHALQINGRSYDELLMAYYY